MNKLFVMFLFVATGCASGLNSMQHQELLGYEAKGFAIEEKSTATAALLGILPGGGSFYTGNYGVGAANLLLWPFSILWDPISGFNGAQEINYHATLTNISKLKSAEFSGLDTRLIAKKIDSAQYIMIKNQIENKYSPIANTSYTSYPVLHQDIEASESTETIKQVRSTLKTNPENKSAPHEFIAPTKKTDTTESDSYYRNVR